MYAMNIHKDVIGLVLRENCKSKQVTDFIAWPSRCHGRIWSLTFPQFCLLGSETIPPPKKNKENPQHNTTQHNTKQHKTTQSKTKQRKKNKKRKQKNNTKQY